MPTVSDLHHITAGDLTFRDVMDAFPAAVYITDAEGIVTFYNKAAEDMAGRTPKIGVDEWCVTWRLYRPDGTRLPVAECPMAVALKEGRPVRDVEVIAERPDGTRAPLMPFPTPLRDASGRIVGAVNMVIDISALKRAEDAAARRADEQAALYRFTDRLYRAESIADVYEASLNAIFAALRCSRASVLCFDDAGVMRFVASRGLSRKYREAVAGHTPWRPGEPDPQPILVEDVAGSELDDALKAVVKGEGIGALAFIPLVANGGAIGKFMVYHDAPHAFSSEEVDLALTIARQLGFAVERHRSAAAQQQAEEQRTLLINELNHRVKNTLATVQSLAMQTLRNTERSEDARPLFDARLTALARAHDLLTAQNWDGAGLREVLARALSPFRTDERRIVMLGPEVRISPKQALAFSIALHELATNAAKYGALSTQRGSVELIWSVSDGKDGQVLHVIWTEKNGPPVGAPTRAGFGTRLIERGLAHELGGTTHIDYRADGVVATISSPLRRGGGGVP